MATFVFSNCPGTSIVFEIVLWILPFVLETKLEFPSLHCRREKSKQQNCSLSFLPEISTAMRRHGETNSSSGSACSWDTSLFGDSPSLAFRGKSLHSSCYQPPPPPPACSVYQIWWGHCPWARGSNSETLLLPTKNVTWLNPWGKLLLFQ